MPTISSSLADFLYDVANFFVITGAAAALLGALGTIWMGSVKERYSDQRMAANEAKAAAANETAANAFERAAGLEKDAAEARLEQEKLKIRSLELEARIKSIGPRTLNEDQVRQILAQSALESFKPPVRFDYLESPEASKYAETIANLLIRGGFSAKEGRRIMAGGRPGISVYDPSGTVQRVLRAANIAFVEAPKDSEDQGAYVEVGQKIPE